MLPSVLDRLIDQEPTNRNEPDSWRAQSLKELKASVRRDLEWLLNSRRPLLEPPDSAKNLWRSVYAYGLPDTTGLSLRSRDDRHRLATVVEIAVASFEPRLMNVKVTVPPSSPTSRVVHFQIEAMLHIEPAPERVFFDTKLELTRGEYEVEGA
jgi:type VI secretion system protein ImpF